MCEGKTQRTAEEVQESQNWSLPCLEPCGEINRSIDIKKNAGQKLYKDVVMVFKSVLLLN